ncbi:hypothetical protein DIJ64_12675 [Mycobacterium leprae]|uniref:Uncharacterized protein n=2 Tax=Mycobacterium leprae TaxID=1769 RepID=A0AAD0KVH5_MYCLR|nr:hypothetical protein [Mycobacterium leprae]AWV48603.1 hypothetical protein DIJ64_12675 [Mycobacterium leprae]OAR21138.1 hypothetical protein A8144_01380 [Mycobacterium leprae 3125609]OAX72135.1 hypothetical protein A3216_01455 [Mycobacterium leprae 7935681]
MAKTMFGAIEFDEYGAEAPLAAAPTSSSLNLLAVSDLDSAYRYGIEVALAESLVAVTLMLLFGLHH